MDETDDIIDDLEELNGYIIQLSSWLPRFLGQLGRFNSLPSPTEFPLVVASIGREFKTVVGDMKSKVLILKRIEELKIKLGPQLSNPKESDLETLAVNLQLLELEWQRASVLVKNVHDHIVVAVKKACVQTFHDEANSKKVKLGQLYIIQEEDEEVNFSKEATPEVSSPDTLRRRKFHLPVSSDESIEIQLAKISTQLFDSSVTLTAMEPCQMSSVALELRIGEVQALRTILEIHHSEITYILETLSPSQMILFTLNDLWEKCGVLIKHFEDTEEQYSEVEELVALFEDDLKQAFGFLKDLTKLPNQASWGDFEQALCKLEDYQVSITSLSELSSQLLTLEPIFNGCCIRDSMEYLAGEYNSTMTFLKEDLQRLVAEKCESYSFDVALVHSWVEQALLLLVHHKNKQIIRSDKMQKELEVHDEMLSQVSHQVSLMTRAIQTASLPPPQELIDQLDTVQDHLCTISLALSARDSGSVDDLSIKRISGHYSLHLGELDNVIHQLTQEIQDPMFTTNLQAQNVEEVDTSDVQLPLELQATANSVEQGIKELNDSIAKLSVPQTLDLDAIHAVIAKCRTYQKVLDMTHHQITSLVEKKAAFRGDQRLEMYVFELSSSWQLASVQLADKINSLHNQEVEVARFNKQVGDLINLMEGAQSLLLNPPLSLREFVRQCSTIKEKMVTLEKDRQSVLKRYDLPTSKSTPDKESIQRKKELLSLTWTQVLQSLGRVSMTQQTVIQRFVRIWEEWSRKAAEEVETLSPSGFMLSKISAKYLQSQQMKQNASAIYDSLHEALPSDQVKELQEDIKGIKEKASVAEEAIHRHLLKLREFLEEYGDLKSWLNDMNTVVQGEQHNIKRQTLCQQIATKEKHMKRVCDLTKEMFLLQANSGEKTRLTVKANDLFDNWDKLCQQCIPAGVLPSSLQIKATSRHEFAAPSDMLKWLMGVATKLRPQTQCLGQEQLTDMLLDIKAIAQEMLALEENYHRLTQKDSVKKENSWMANQQKRLQSLWQEVSTLVKERQDSLESLQDLWTQFDSKKDKFLNLLRMAESRVEKPHIIEGSHDLAVMDAEIKRERDCSAEVMQCDEYLEALESLATSLLNYHYHGNQSSDLTKTVATLKTRWTKVKPQFNSHCQSVSKVYQKWVPFFGCYSRLQQWTLTMQVKASELKGRPTSMKMVAHQKELIKVIILESEVKRDLVEAVHSSLHQLREEMNGYSLNIATVSERVDVLMKKVENLLQLAKKKQEVLESVLLERQQVLAQLASRMAWLLQAQTLLKELYPLGQDLVEVDRQYCKMEGFWKEYEEQVEKMEYVLMASVQLMSYRPETDEEKSVLDLVKLQYARLSEIWESVQEQAHAARETLNTVHPKLVHFQELCSEAGKLLSSAEMILASSQPIAKTLPKLREQSSTHADLEVSLQPISQCLQDIETAKGDLKSSGLQISTDLKNLLARFERRWLEVSRYAQARGVRIKEMLAKFGGAAMTVKDGTLPRGWSKMRNRNNIPLYTVCVRDGGTFTQTQHPELTALFSDLNTRYSHVHFGLYRTSLKIRALQKKLQLHFLSSQRALQIFASHLDNTEDALPISLLTEPLSTLYQQAEKDHSGKVKCGQNIDMTTSWILDMHNSNDSVLPVALKTSILILTGGKLEDKLKNLFTACANSSGEIVPKVFQSILNCLIKIPVSVGEGEVFTDNLVYEGMQALPQGIKSIKMANWLSWIRHNPKVLSWLPLLHRLAQTERKRHSVKCFICQLNPIVGFRYRCLECFKVDLCQDCFWSGRSLDHHKSNHSVQEYCLEASKTENVKDFFKTLGNKMKRSSPGGSIRRPPPFQSPSLAHHHRVSTHSDTSESSVFSSTDLEDTSKEVRDEELDTLIVQLEEENRDLLEQLNSLQIELRSAPPSQVSSDLVCLQESRQALESRICYLQTHNNKLITQIGKLRSIIQQGQELMGV